MVRIFTPQHLPVGGSLGNFADEEDGEHHARRAAQIAPGERGQFRRRQEGVNFHFRSREGCQGGEVESAFAAYLHVGDVFIPIHRTNQRAESGSCGGATTGTTISVVVSSMGIAPAVSSTVTFALPATTPFGKSNSVV